MGCVVQCGLLLFGVGGGVVGVVVGGWVYVVCILCQFVVFVCWFDFCCVVGDGLVCVVGIGVLCDGGYIVD